MSYCPLVSEQTLYNQTCICGHLYGSRGDICGIDEPVLRSHLSKAAIFFRPLGDPLKDRFDCIFI